ncbi:MAG: di-trans,poly-cis-decaprenylcistransferase [Candidatus Aenigmarchaeota archaeon]|nr:di-trans,poly-cis-decaprenylcistransferase [Candidatus Aenigmarchaeota archaeon]
MNVPNHVALIPDGNRRWAKARGKPPWEGHWAAEKVLDNFLDWCVEMNIPEVSLWVGSTENLTKRPEREVKELYILYYKLLEKWANKESKLDQYRVNTKFIGELNKLPKKIQELMNKIEKNTSKYHDRKFNILINYGGRFELTQVFKKLAKQQAKITEKTIDDNMLVKTPVDLIIRTGGYSRLSNFMLWQSAYAEIYITKTFLPDFDKKEFMKALKWFDSTTRNFGK